MICLLMLKNSKDLFLFIQLGKLVISMKIIVQKEKLKLKSLTIMVSKQPSHVFLILLTVDPTHVLEIFIMSLMMPPKLLSSAYVCQMKRSTLHLSGKSI